MPDVHCKKEDLIWCWGSAAPSMLALALGLLQVDAWHAGSIWMSLLALVPVLIRMQLGKVLRQRLSAVTFRRVLFAGLLLLGLYLALA